MQADEQKELSHKLLIKEEPYIIITNPGNSSNLKMPKDSVIVKESFFEKAMTHNQELQANGANPGGADNGAQQNA